MITLNYIMFQFDSIQLNSNSMKKQLNKQSKILSKNDNNFDLYQQQHN
jgi:hypothetical protein